MESEVLTIGQVSEKYGIPTLRIRYFCKHGLVLHVRRNSRRERIFNLAQCELIGILYHLYECGLSVKELKKYVRADTIGQKAILVTHLHQLREEIKILSKNADYLSQCEEVLDEKIGQNA